MASGLRVSELTHLQRKNLDLKTGVLRVPVSKTAAGLREIALEQELVRLLREHKLAANGPNPTASYSPGAFGTRRGTATASGPKSSIPRSSGPTSN
jgi:integrase